MRFIVVFWTLICFYCLPLFSQEVKMSEAHYSIQNNNDTPQNVLTCCYTIENSDTARVVVFFIEGENTSDSKIELLRRKLLHKYSDFRLSMIEWESNMRIDSKYCIVPELFVKCLSPGETFRIIAFSDEKQTDDISRNLSKHLLICKDIDFSNPAIGMPDFLTNLQRHNMDYPASYIVLNMGSVKEFFNDSTRIL